MSEIGTLEIDAGDAPAFTVTVAPADVDTAMTAALVDSAEAETAFTMTPNAGRDTWTGTGPIVTVPGEYTARFTVTGTGSGVQFYTVVVAVPPPLTADLRRLRLLIADTNPANRLFRLDELQDFLDLARGAGTAKLKRAAATALETIAISEALVGKVIRTQDLSTDAAKLAAELRAQAASLRGQADDDEDNDPDDGGGFFVVDFVPPFSRYAGELAEAEEV